MQSPPGGFPDARKKRQSDAREQRGKTSCRRATAIRMLFAGWSLKRLYHMQPVIWAYNELKKENSI
jgi:hypothetical protein